MSIDDMVLGPDGAGDENMCLERASANYICKVRHEGLRMEHHQFLTTMVHGWMSQVKTWKCAMQDDRFRLQKKSYDNQYAQLYYCRLLRMQPGLTKRIQKEWPGTRCKPPPPLMLDTVTWQLTLPTAPQLTADILYICSVQDSGPARESGGGCGGDDLQGDEVEALNLEGVQQGDTSSILCTHCDALTACSEQT